MTAKGIKTLPEASPASVTSYWGGLQTFHCVLVHLASTSPALERMKGNVKKLK